MTQHALYVELEAKPGKEQEVASFLSSARKMVNDEPDTTAWFAIRIGPNRLFDAEQYANWQYADQRSDWAVEASTIAELRAGGQHAIVTPDECVELVRRDGAALLHPLCGGIDPDIGWESLELVHTKVMPALAAG